MQKLFWRENWRTPLRNTRLLTSNAELEQKQLGDEIKPMGAEVITTAIKNVNVCVILNGFPKLKNVSVFMSVHVTCRSVTDNTRRHITRQI